jgi:hypothetical protein
MGILKKLQRHGLFGSMRIAYWLVVSFWRKINPWYRKSDLSRFSDNLIEIRTYLSAQVNAFADDTVLYGAYKGLRLPNHKWGILDKPAMYLGLYEIEVTEELVKLSKTGRRTLVDVGAADGFHALGALINNDFTTCYAFESDPESQFRLQKNADANSLSGRLSIYGKADANFLDVLNIDLSKSVFLFDIEGGEWSLLTRSLFRSLSLSVLIVEIHLWDQEANTALEQLLGFSIHTHSHNFLETGPRDLSTIPEISSFGDDFRWLMCSEGRGMSMRWIVFEPLTL